MIKRISLTASSLLIKVKKSNNQKIYQIYFPIIVNKFSTHKGIKTIEEERVPPPPAVNSADAWEMVKVPEGIYWWNTVTDETTALGAPKPSGPTAVGQPQQGQSLMGVMAEGAAWGVGNIIIIIIIIIIILSLYYNHIIII